MLNISIFVAYFQTRRYSNISRHEVQIAKYTIHQKTRTAAVIGKRETIPSAEETMLDQNRWTLSDNRAKYYKKKKSMLSYAVKLGICFQVL